MTRITSKKARFDSASRDGICATKSWEKSLRWASPGLKKLVSKNGPARWAFERMLDSHLRALPARLRAGEEVVTELEDDELFPDTVYLMTACGSNPSWERSKTGSIRLHTLIGYPSSF